MKIVSVVSSRAQLVKMGPVDRALGLAGCEHVVIHTGRPYDPMVIDTCQELSLDLPQHHLGVSSGTPGVQAGAVLARLDELLFTLAPDWTMVYDDTSATLAGALAAASLGVPVAHLEAGVRSHNRRMPEERHRVLTDHAADLLLAPTQRALQNLAREGLAERAVVVGDVMTDVCLETQARVRDRCPVLPEGVAAEEPYVLASLHRSEIVDDPDRLATVIESLRTCPSPVALLVHPRLRVRCDSYGIPLHGGSLQEAAPMSYPDMVRALMGAAGVVTDSGQLQKEAYLLQVPCTTVRAETEWAETLEGGWNVLDPGARRVHELAARQRPATRPGHPYGQGDAASRVAELLCAGRAATGGGRTWA